MTSTWLDGFFTIRFANESEQRELPDNDFRSKGMLLFYHIAGFCSFAQETITNAKDMFLQDEFISANALPRMYKTVYTHSSRKSNSIEI